MFTRRQALLGTAAAASIAAPAAMAEYLNQAAAEPLLSFIRRCQVGAQLGRTTCSTP